ncbi:Ig-like domain-containing protein, partial [Escherichia coli]|nr:Ig-like domain-containing protein [Escherichia coli]
MNILNVYTSDNRLDFSPNEKAVVIAKLTDSNKKPLSGVNIKWHAISDELDAKVNTSPENCITDNNGLATFTISSDISNAITITAYATGGGEGSICIGTASSNLKPPSIINSSDSSIAYLITVFRHVTQPHKGDIYHVYWDGYLIGNIEDTNTPGEFPGIVTVNRNAEYLSTGNHYIYYIIKGADGNI